MKPDTLHLALRDHEPTHAPFPAPPDRAAFLWKFLRAPLTIGSPTPSSRFLADRVARCVPWARVGSLAELGAGTGALTRAIRARCRTDCRVLVFERDPALRAWLEAAYPDFVHRADARTLKDALRELALPSVDCVVSGLPFAFFPRALRDEVMDQVTASLAPGGLFVAFQYSPQMRASLKRRFREVRLRFVPFNLPPALVYVCRK
jgi:phospholipid N-methyltransferase